MDWYLEDLNGNHHRAEFVEMKRSNAKDMKWNKKIKWLRELILQKTDGRKVYKLIDSKTKKAQGGISFSEAEDHVYVHLIESATHNRENPRLFINVARLLIAFAGKRSIDTGGDGFLALEPKSYLEGYYEKRFRSFPLTGRKVGIPDAVTKHWIGVYYR